MKEKTEKLIKAFGLLTTEEAQLLMNVAELLPKGSVVVNIGAGVGTSALAIIEQRPDLAKTFYTIDHRDDDNPFGGMLNELHAFQNAKMEHLLPNQIKGDSSTVGAGWKNGKINMLIVDADHTKDGLMKDMLAWLPHLAVSGFVAFHDYTAEKWPDVYTTIEETVMRDESYEYVEMRDTMIVFRKLREPKPEKEATAELAEEESMPESIYRKADERTSKRDIAVEEHKEPVEKKPVSTRQKKVKKTENELSKE